MKNSPVSIKIPDFGRSLIHQNSKSTNFANIVCSRESTYRTILDITAFDFPIILASAFRNFKNCIESAFECFYGTAILFFSPMVTSWVAKGLGQFLLPENMQKNIPDYLRFSMNEAKSKKSLEAGLIRIANEETEDKNFISSIFQKAGNLEYGKKYELEAEELKRFCTEFTPTEEIAKQIYKLKKATIICESLIEGTWSTSVSLATRLFRKYILSEDRFTGTKGYLSDEESAQLGETEELSKIQKVFAGGLCFLSPAINSILLKITEKQEKIKDSKFLETVSDQIDMTHGVYPKLGLLLLFTVPAKWTGHIAFSQGNFERVEKILKFFTVVTSWWIGHRFTNGLLAKNADKHLTEKFKIEPGILINKNYYEQSNSKNFFIKLRTKYPEPAKILEIFKSIDRTDLSSEKKEKLRHEAEKKHAECFYKGFTFHSLLVWGINMAVNQITKLRAKSALSG